MTTPEYHRLPIIRYHLAKEHPPSDNVIREARMLLPAAHILKPTSPQRTGKLKSSNLLFSDGSTWMPLSADTGDIGVNAVFWPRPSANEVD